MDVTSKIDLIMEKKTQTLINKLALCFQLILEVHVNTHLCVVKG